METNTAMISGIIEDEAVFSHSVYGEGFYTFHVCVPRLSETNDIIPVTISERLMEPDALHVGERVEVSGQFRSYNNYTETGNRLMLTLFARDVQFPKEASLSPNEITLVGYLCKPPVYRHTPFGREISDMLLAVNRSYNKSDYIPCIAWGRNARFSRNLAVGDKVQLSGRIQSREYRKKVAEDVFVSKTAYEISVIKIEACAE
ncbi:MAG: single-stranded DNA-binding protein [Clostridia bacterium]|nr:single-stranded DNA-binding protein [Clostridia bacterium]